MAKKKNTNTSKPKVTVDVVQPKNVKAPYFEYKGVQIPKSFGRIKKEEFWRMFKGKIRFDINAFWEAYQDYLK